jgi:hypothetical protein
MSGTLAQSSLRVRGLIQDVDLGNPVIGTYSRLNPTLMRVAQELTGPIGMARYWVASAFTTIALSTADYTLSAGIKYNAIHRLRDTYFGRVIDKVTLGEIEVLRYGIKVNQLRTGDPIAFAIWEDNTQVPNIRLDRVPVRATAFDVEISALPTYGITDATTLPFNELALAAIERETAAELIDGMSDEAVARLGITRDLATVFHKKAADDINAEKARLRRMVARPYAVGSVVG